MAPYKDLKRVGQWLRAQRTEQHIARTDLARRVGVSPTYLWMVEEARERANGEASQPSQFLLRQLATELAMTDRDSHDLLRLAGYTPIEDGPVDLQAHLVSGTTGSAFVDLVRTGSRQRILGLLDALQTEILGSNTDNESVLPRFHAHLTVFQPESQLSDALALMDEQRYSQVVVQVEGHIRLLSSEGIMRWLLAGGLMRPLTAVPISDVLPSEPPDSMVVRSGSSAIGDAMAALVDEPSVVAIVLTPSGDHTESPLGIITAWDMVDYTRGQIVDL